MPGAITIATNMAGRGTDIELGGNLKLRLEEALEGVEDPGQRTTVEEEVRAAVRRDKEAVLASGGLFVVGTERHESRRIDNQLRGRAGRQGDPGASQFFLSLEDDLMRIFGSERLDEWLKKLGLQEGEAITHPWINRALEKAQQKIEARNFEVRKHLLKYDDVMNDQRKAIYAQRHYLMSKDDVQEECVDMRASVLESLVSAAMPPQSYPDQWNVSMLHEEILRLFDLDLSFASWVEEEGISPEIIQQRIQDTLEEAYRAKEERLGAHVVRTAERNMLLKILDQAWKDHLYALDHLRQGVHLRSYAQRDPLNEYKREAFTLFEGMLDTIAQKICEFLSHFEVQPETAESVLQALIDDTEMTEVIYNREDEEPLEAAPPPTVKAKRGRRPQGVLMSSPVSASSADTPPPALGEDDPYKDMNLSRNALCPCGSRKRYKNCHGALG
jgi:preprotein translocase subunit SecA